MQRTISVIIPNLNSPVIDRTLTALRHQNIDLSGVEVLVVGVDEPGLVSTDELVRFIDTGGPTSAACNRNRGMAEAMGDIFCFTDADCIPAPDWLARLTAPYMAHSADVVGGGVVFDTDSYWSTCDNLSWFYQFLATSSPGLRQHLPTLNLSVGRWVVEEVGMMDESYPLAAGEDTEWTERMCAQGYQLHFEPGATVTHIGGRTNLQALLRHGYQYGRFTTKIGDRAGGTGLSAQPLPGPLRHWWLLLLSSPLVALAATLRALSAARPAHAWRMIPGVWLSKMAWCMGAVQILRSRSGRDIIDSTL